MTVGDRILMKNYDTVLIKKQQKHHHYHLKKLINVNILQVQKYYLLIEVK